MTIVPLMVIDDLDIVGILIAPPKADAPLIVDSNGMLTGAVSLERFKAEARILEVVKRSNSVEQSDPTLGSSLEGLEPRDPMTLEQAFRVLRGEGSNHMISVLRKI